MQQLSQDLAAQNAQRQQELNAMFEQNMQRIQANSVSSSGSGSSGSGDSAISLPASDFHLTLTRYSDDQPPPYIPPPPKVKPPKVAPVQRAPVKPGKPGCCVQRN